MWLQCPLGEGGCSEHERVRVLVLGAARLLKLAQVALDPEVDRETTTLAEAIENVSSFPTEY